MRLSLTVKIGILLFWLIIALISISQSLLSTIIYQREVDWPVTLIWSSGWLIWVFLTPLILYLAQKYPIEKHEIRQGILWHLLLGLLVCLLQFVLEAGFNYFAYIFIKNISPSPYWYVGLLSYKFHVYLFIYFFIAGVAHALSYYQKYQTSELATSQLENQLNQAQLQSLKMQLQPHFLFNAHHAIVALMLKNENEKAIQMLNNLSDLLRSSLKNQDVQLITLEQEMEFIRLFLDIHQIRFHHRLKIHYEIPDEIKEALIPNFILQPLVENAIKHGISPSSTAEKICIQAQKADNQLLITIKDDGKGLNEKGLEEGIGLKNTRKRLRQLFENDFDFSLKNNEEGGAIARLLIPYIEYEK